MMNVSDCRYVVTIQQKTITRDIYGAETVVYVDYLTLRASVKYNGGTKVIDSKEVFASQTLVFETHFRSITTDMIILFNSNKYRILSIDEVGYRQSLKINAELINE